MKTVKYYRIINEEFVYMGWLKACPKNMGNVMSWLNSDKQKHVVEINKTRFMAFHVLGAINAMKGS